MLLNALFARKKPCIGIKKMKLIEYTGNAQSVNEFMKNKGEINEIYRVTTNI